MIDLVCVVRCDNKLLYDRLKARGYGAQKLEENMDCEIMEVLSQEARDAYDVSNDLIQFHQLAVIIQ